MYSEDAGKINDDFRNATKIATRDNQAFIWALWGLARAIFYGLHAIADAITRK